MLKLELQYFDHPMRRANSLENTLMLRKIEGRRRRGDREDGWMASGESEGQGILACCHSGGHKESDTTM